jgi:hypothetical protein
MPQRLKPVVLTAFIAALKRRATLKTGGPIRISRFSKVGIPPPCASWGCVKLELAG